MLGGRALAMWPWRDVGAPPRAPGALSALEQAIERGVYPAEYIAVHCPFLAPLRGTPEFARLAARAAERVAEFRA